MKVQHCLPGWLGEKCRSGMIQLGASREQSRGRGDTRDDLRGWHLCSQGYSWCEINCSLVWAGTQNFLYTVIAQMLSPGRLPSLPWGTLCRQEVRQEASVKTSLGWAIKSNFLSSLPHLLHFSLSFFFNIQTCGTLLPLWNLSNSFHPGHCWWLFCICWMIFICSVFFFLRQSTAPLPVPVIVFCKVPGKTQNQVDLD